MPKDIMDVKEIAEYLGFSPTKIYRMLAADEIPRVKVGGQYRFPKTVIDDWLSGKLSLGSAASLGRTGSDGTEDKIIKYLVNYKNGVLSDKQKAKKTIKKSLDRLDWAYLAAAADKQGVREAAIDLIEEIENET